MHPATMLKIFITRVSLGSSQRAKRVFTRNGKQVTAAITLTDTYFVNQPFCFVERKHGIDITTQNWKEKSIQEKQTAGIVCVKDNKAGIGFISDFGLHECAVTEKNDIYITMEFIATADNKLFHKPHSFLKRFFYR